MNDKELFEKAQKIHDRALESGLENDFLLAAELYEKCGYYDKARKCRDAASRVEWTAEEILKREG